MKLRQKLAMVLASAMILTAVPVVTYAASTARVTTVATSTSGAELGDNAPTLKIDLKDGLDVNESFYLLFENASWNVDGAIQAEITGAGSGTVVVEKEVDDTTKPVWDETKPVFDTTKPVYDETKPVNDADGNAPTIANPDYTDDVTTPDEPQTIPNPAWTPTYEQKEDADGNPVYEQKVDEHGNPVWEQKLDEQGNPVWEQKVITEEQSVPIADIFEVVANGKKGSKELGFTLQVKEGVDTDLTRLPDDTELSLKLTTKLSGGDAMVTIDGEGTNVGIVSKLVFATTKTAGVTAKAGTATSISEDGGKVASITITENVAGSFAKMVRDGHEVINITLEDDSFEFIQEGTAEFGKGLTGTASTAINVKDPQTLEITIPSNVASSERPATLTLKDVGVEPVDRKDFKAGDVKANVNGKGVESVDVTLSKAVITNASISVKDDKVVEMVSGQDDTVKVVLKESYAGSFVDGRKVDVTLDKGYMLVFDENEETDYDGIQEFEEYAVAQIEAGMPAGLEVIDVDINKYDQVVGFTVAYDKATSGTAATKSFEMSVPVILPISVEDGEVKLTFDGKLIDDETVDVVVAKAEAPFEVETETANLKVGLRGQKGGSITITETEKGSIERGEIKIAVEELDFSGKPVVEVTEGNIKVNEVSYKDNVVTLDITRTSSEASTIVISDFVISTDRSVPQGEFYADIYGDAVTKHGKMRVADFVVVGTLNTEDLNSSNGMKAGTSAFTNGATKYMVNDEEKEMDATPYIAQSGRMMLPLRYVADAFGINGDNVIFTKADGAVTIVAGNRTVQVKNGSNVATLNGVQLTMDEKVIIKDDRTFIPVGEVGRLLGVSIDFDDATKTATFTNK